MKEQQVQQAITRLHELYQRGQLPQALYETKRKELLAQLNPNEFVDPASQSPVNQGLRPLSTAGLATRRFPTPPSRVPNAQIHNFIPRQGTLGEPTMEEEAESSQGIPTPGDLDQVRQLRVGDLVRGRYRLTKLLGSGGMGQVFLAEDLRFSGKYALKVLHPWVVSHEPTISRFVQEFKIMERLNHPGIVRTYLLDEDTAHESLFYLMEYVDGETLQTILDRNLAQRDIPPFSGDETLEFLEKLTGVLRYTHDRHILHRDLKPTNIMMVEQSGTSALKLLDFGLAKRLTGTNDDALHTGQAGTFFYIAPEQLMGGETATIAADIFSMGVIIYQMLTGSLPVAMATPPSEINPSLPKKVDHVLRKAMDVHWQNRYQTVDEFFDAFVEVFRHSPPPPSHAQSSQHESRSASAPSETGSHLNAFDSTDSSAPSPPSSSEWGDHSSSQRWSSSPSTSGSVSLSSQDQWRSGERSSSSLSDSGWSSPSRSSSSRHPVSGSYNHSKRTTPSQDVVKNPSSSGTISNAQRIARLRSGPTPKREPLFRKAPTTPASQRAQYLHAFPAHSKDVKKLALNPDGTFLASASMDATVKLWETRSWFPLHTIEAGNRGILDLAWREQGHQLVILELSGTIQVWNILTMESVFRFATNTSPHCMALDSQGRILCIGCEDGSLELWDLQTQQRMDILRHHSTCVTAIQLHPKKQLMVSGDNAGTLHAWDIRNKSKLFSLQSSSHAISSLALAPTGSKLLAGSSEGILTFWDLQRQHAHQEWQAHSRDVTDIAFSPSGSWFASCGKEPLVRMWKLNEDDSIHSFTDPQSPVQRLTVSIDGRWLATAGRDHMIKIWDTSIWGA